MLLLNQFSKYFPDILHFNNSQGGKFHFVTNFNVDDFDAQWIIDYPKIGQPNPSQKMKFNFVRHAVV